VRKFKPSKLLLVIVVTFLFLSFLVSIELFLVVYRTGKTRNNLSSIQNGTQNCVLPSMYQPSIPFVQSDGGIYIVDDKERHVLKTIAQDIYGNQSMFGNAVLSVKNSGNLIATLVGVDKTNYGYTRKILYLTDLDSLEHIKVMDITERGLDETGDKHLAIRDFAFSPDGKLLAITTTTSVNVYDISTKKLKTVYSVDEETIGNSVFFGFYNPVFSDNNELLIVLEAYYEGSSSKVLDLGSAKFLDISGGSYTSGEEFVGWYNNKLISYRFNFEGEEVKKEPNSLFLVNPRNAEDKKLIKDFSATADSPKIENLLPNGFMVYDGNIYFIAREQTDKKIVFCNNQPLSIRSESLHKINLATLQDEVVLRKDTTLDKLNNINFSLSFLGFYNLNELSQPVVKIDSNFSKMLGVPLTDDQNGIKRIFIE
jgi:hypothetical protein